MKNELNKKIKEYGFEDEVIDENPLKTITANDIDRPIVDVTEAAKYLGVTKETLYGYVYQKAIPYLKVRNRRIYFKPEDLKHFLLKDENYVKPKKK